MELINELKNGFLPEIILMLFILINIICMFTIKKHPYKMAKATAISALIIPLLAFYTMPVSNIFSVAMKIIILISSLLILLASHNLLISRRDKSFQFFTIFLCAVLSALGLVTFNNLIYSCFSFVLLGIFSCLLIKFRNNEKSKEASTLYVSSLLTASILFILGISLFYLYTGNIDIIYINTILPVFANNIYYLIADLCIILPFILMLGIIPLFNLQENICDKSSSGISAYLTIIPTIAYIGFLCRFFVFVSATNNISKILISGIMAFVIFCSSFRLIKETNIKKIYSHSTIINAAFFIIAITGCSVYSLSTVIFGLFAYIFTMAGLWSVFIILNTRYKSVDISDYKGLFYTRPYFSLAYILCIISIIGLPPTGCFIARIYEFSALLKTNMPAFYFIILFTSIISLIALSYCYLKLIKTMFEKNDNNISINKMFIIPKITLYVCALAILLIFIYPDKIIKISQFISYYM